MRAALICLLLALSTFASAQPPLTRFSFVDSARYELTRPLGYYLRECGHEVVEIAILDPKGAFYRVIITRTQFDTLHPGSPVTIKREYLP